MDLTPLFSAAGAVGAAALVAYETGKTAALSRVRSASVRARRLYVAAGAAVGAAVGAIAAAVAEAIK